MTNLGEIRVAWSEEDKAWIAKSSLYESLVAHGPTAAIAVGEMQLVLQDIEEEKERPMGVAEASGFYNTLLRGKEEDWVRDYGQDGLRSWVDNDGVQEVAEAIRKDAREYCGVELRSRELVDAIEHVLSEET